MRLRLLSATLYLVRSVPGGSKLPERFRGWFGPKKLLGRIRGLSGGLSEHREEFMPGGCRPISATIGKIFPGKGAKPQPL